MHGLFQFLARGGQSNTAAADHCRHCLCGVPMTSRLLKIIGLFRRISFLLYGSFPKETCNFKEATNRSHPICYPMCPRWAPAVSFEYCFFYMALLQKRPIILRQSVLLDSASSSCGCTFSSNFCFAIAKRICSNPCRTVLLKENLGSPLKNAPKTTQIGGRVIVWYK